MIVPAAVSVVIPVLNAQSSLPGCLQALMEGLESGLIRELILSDGGSTDATKEIADQVGARWVSGAPSRGGQLRRGVAQARGQWLLVLHADTVLQPGWSAAIQAHLDGSMRAGYGRLRFDMGGPWPRLVAGWANRRAAWFGLPYGDQGLLISRALYDQVGGYRDIPLMEDVAMARALRGQLSALEFNAQTSAAKYVQTGWLRRGARNLWLLFRYLTGADPVDLARAYRR